MINNEHKLYIIFITILKQQIQSTMIVKNTSTNSHFLNHQAPLKPYFLQGLQYARQLLQQLKKQKQADEHLQYSPINQKHTKFSSDVIIQQELIYHNQFQERDQRGRKEKKERKENNYIGLGDVERQQDKEIRRSNQNVLIKKNKKIRTQSLDDNDGGSSLKKTKYKLSDHQDNTSMVVYEQYEDNNKSSKFAQFSQLYNNTGPQKTAQSQFYSQLRQKQQKINWMGEQLQSLNSQIQSYETIFDNLCDCYRANQHISTKNHKLRREAIRLQQEKSQILAKIANIGQQMRAFEQMEKQANQFVGVNVENYVRELIMYNQDIQIDSIGVDGKVEVEYQGVKDNEEAGNSSEQEFEKKLTLNYKKLKERYQIKMKKKSTLEPKKLQKGVSFEQQIDVIAKFYQNQLTNI